MYEKSEITRILRNLCYNIDTIIVKEILAYVH